MSSESTLIHALEHDDDITAPSPKRIKLDSSLQTESVLPPSHSLLGIPLPVAPSGQPINFTEADVGISEYVATDIPKVEAIIKQRFTDFLVYEVDLDSNVIHLKDIGKPKSSQNVAESDTSREADTIEDVDSQEPWPEHFTTELSTFLSQEKVLEVKQIYLECLATASTDPSEVSRNKGRHQKGSGEDKKQVISDPIASKETRTALHHVVRRLFKGKMESETGEGSCIVIRWARQGRGGRGASRGTHPAYIHFSLQKTNRDTQDALGQLSRLLHVNVKDLSVAGTKDKRGVTVQRVSFKRGNKTVEDVWTMVNGINRRKPAETALKQRGERGIRIADLKYRKASLELGMLKGNAFLITLRNVKAQSIEALEQAMNSIKTKGFINYYGMQRFGTASIPTHAIGLALLKSEWQKAVSLLLSVRPGEHPDVTAAREAWLKDRDIDRALELLPRRVVAERCILESFKKQKGDTRNAMGALSTIPRNLRLMYVHAYQSYVWNAIVSERIRMYGAENPVVGDLVFESESDDQNLDAECEPEEFEPESTTSSEKRSRKPWSPPRIKTLTEEDLKKYSIFDVIMPLPGTDVAYPGGMLGEKYREFLHADGLDPDNFTRKQRDYTLRGSYRAILHLPKEMAWSVLRYTDPDVALAQADEDKLLGFEPAVTVDDGVFLALQISLRLGTAAYATMALREVTKTDTGSHHQMALTQASEDQKYRGYEEEANN
ncbi:pseudouridine synthase [Amanita rubescens]|nr:pseudouridine synthase [Amanita rubescens]